MTRLAGGIVDVTDFPRMRFIKKAATESVTSSTTLQNDDDFVVTLAANQIYKISLHVVATGAAAGDIKIAWAVTSTVTAKTNRHSDGPGTSTTDSGNSAAQRASGAHGLTTSVTYGTDGTNGSKIVEDFLIDGGASGGTLTMQWAQNTSSGTATTVNSNSFLLIQEVEEY